LIFLGRSPIAVTENCPNPNESASKKSNQKIRLDGSAKIFLFHGPEYFFSTISFPILVYVSKFSISTL